MRVHKTCRANARGGRCTLRPGEQLAILYCQEPIAKRGWFQCGQGRGGLQPALISRRSLRIFPFSPFLSPHQTPSLAETAGAGAPLEPVGKVITMMDPELVSTEAPAVGQGAANGSASEVSFPLSCRHRRSFCSLFARARFLATRSPSLVVAQ